MARVQVYKNERGKAEYLKLYQDTLKLWPIPYTELDLNTSYGSTHVITCGDSSSFPLILLPGIATSATMWFPNVRSFSSKYRVYALDTPGDVGKSLPQKVPQTPLQWSEWFAEVLQSLGIERAHVAGHCFGGWLTMVLALHKPELVEKAVVIAPSGGFTTPKWQQFSAKMLLTELIPSKAMKRQSVLKYVYQKDQIPERFVQQLISANRCRNYKLAPTVFTDEELRKIYTPVLLLIGQKEVVSRPEKATERAQQLLPKIKVRFVKDTSHFPTIEQPGVVNGYMEAFLAT